MFGIHITAIICFVISAVLYVFGEDFAAGFSTLGIVFELIAWFIWMVTSESE